MSKVISSEQEKFIVSYLIDKGCDAIDIHHILNKFPQILFMNKDELDKNITFIFNEESLYGIVYCKDNEYIEYVLNKEIIDDVIEDDNSKHVSNDYVISNFLDSLNKEYIKKIAGINDNDTMENKLNKFKNIDFNGYKVR